MTFFFTFFSVTVYILWPYTVLSGLKKTHLLNSWRPMLLKMDSSVTTLKKFFHGYWSVLGFWVFLFVCFWINFGQLKISNTAISKKKKKLSFTRVSSFLYGVISSVSVLSFLFFAVSLFYSWLDLPELALFPAPFSPPTPAPQNQN